MNENKTSDFILTDRPAKRAWEKPEVKKLSITSETMKPVPSPFESGVTFGAHS
jgi:hypothetical protein